MRRFCWLALLVACACQFEKSDPTEGQGAARPTPQAPPPTKTPPPQLDDKVSPWTPRIKAAEFFSRPADSWTQNDLGLANYSLDVKVAEGIATSTLDVSVTNGTSAQAEAVIKLPIPPGAAVTGATLWVGDKPMVGVMLGSAKARKVYDEIVGKRRDPLLVTWSAADMLSLQIFPLEAKQTRRFKVTWVEPSVGERHWVPSFHNKGKKIGTPNPVTVNGKVTTRNGQWVTVPRTQPASGGDWRLVPQSTMTATSISVVIDTSGELSARRGPQWEEFESFLRGLGGRTKVSLFAADWMFEELGSGRRKEDFIDAKKQFMAIRSAGIFDHDPVMAKAIQHAGTSGAVAVFSGRQRHSSGLEKDHAAPVFWLDKHRSTNDPAIVARSGGKLAPDGAALAKTIHPLIRPAVTGFDWLPLSTASGYVVWLGSRSQNVATPGVKPGPVEALFYKAMLRRADIPLNKIVSPRTSILVLESDEHYKKYGIKDAKGKVVRKGNASKEENVAGLLKEGESAEGFGFGLSGVGPGGGGTGWSTIGTGRYGTIGYGSGTGSGYGIGKGGMRGRKSSVPQVRIGRATVQGSLDKNIIRRYIRRKLPRLRWCYEKQLLEHDGLAGKVDTEFVIKANGQTASVSAVMNHADGKRASECIKKTLKTIRFPKPRGGGIVKVKYPFKLSPGPATLWSKAQKHLKKGGPGLEKKIGAVFGYTGNSDRILLAWWLAENHLRSYATPASGYITVATLLRDPTSKSATDEKDARRILSEGARRYPKVVSKVFKKWGMTSDAKRANELLFRGHSRQLNWGGFGTR